MTTKQVTSLALAAIVLGGLAFLSSNNKKMKTPLMVGKPLIKNLDLTSVQKLEVTENGKPKFTLALTENGWVIPSLFNYPADITKIRANLLRLQELKIGHVATGKKLTNPALVDFQNAAGKSLATVRLGEPHMREAKGQMAMYGGGAYPDGRYVATESEQVFLVGDPLNMFDDGVRTWTETQIASVPAADVVTVEFKNNGETLKMDRKDGKWLLAGLSDKEEIDTSKTYNLDSGLSYLNFSSVADPKRSSADLGLTTGAVYTIHLKNGESYMAKLGNAVGSDRYCQLTAAFTATGTNATENATSTAKVKTFNENVGTWTYVIPASSADTMIKRRADVVKAKEEKKDDTKPNEPKN